MRIVFHGANAAAFSHGFADLLEGPAEITILPDALPRGGSRNVPGRGHHHRHKVRRHPPAPRCAAPLSPPRRRLRRHRARRAPARRNRLQLLRPRGRHRRIRHGRPPATRRPPRRRRCRTTPRRLALLGRRAGTHPCRDRRNHARPARLRPYRQGRRRPRRRLRHARPRRQPQPGGGGGRRRSLFRMGCPEGVLGRRRRHRGDRPVDRGNPRHRRRRSTPGDARQRLRHQRRTGSGDRRTGVVRRPERTSDRWRGHRHLVSLSRRRRVDRRPLRPALRLPPERADDAAHVRLDQRHDPSPPGGHGGEYHPPDPRRALRKTSCITVDAGKISRYSKPNHRPKTRPNQDTPGRAQ